MSEQDHMAIMAGLGEFRPGRRQMVVALRAASLLSAISCAYGVLIGGPAGLLSPFEWVAVPTAGIVSLVALLSLSRVSLEGLVRVSRGLAIFYCAYLAANFANAALIVGSLETASIYLNWTVPAFVFAFLLVGRRLAGWITMPTSAAMTAVVVAYVIGRGSAAVATIQVAVLITAVLAQYVAIALLMRVSRFRELYAVERARAITAGERLVASETLAQQLQASETRYRSLIENSLDVICVLDSEGRFRDVSARCRDAWDYEPGELTGRSLADITHPEDKEALAAFLHGMPRHQTPASVEIRIMGRRGRTVPMLWLARWVQQEGAIHAAARDVSERVEAEARIRQSQKLEAVGQLTGGVAHDFNNLLTVVIGNASIIERHAKDTPTRSLAAMIRAAAERGADLTRRLLTFARRQPLRPRSVELTDLVQGGVPLIARAVGEHIVIRVEKPSGTLWTKVDPAELESAILNLAINARDAMPAGGTLTFRIGEATIGSGGGPTGDLEPGRYATLEVADTGSGMTAEVMARAVEPFFTTKPPGKGTGLGLSAVYGFARQSGGGIRLDSDIGRGTIVTIFLPLAEPAVPVEPAGTLDLPTGREGGRILVVEDDTLVRNFVAKQLERWGYDVEAVGDARAALERLDSGAAYDLLFTDIVMPGGMNGRQLAEEVRRRLPGLPILLTSGFSDDQGTADAAEAGPFPIIRKPYSPSQLVRVIREQLGEPA